jgi:aldehyde dehydrogenase (NAD+)
LPNYVKDVYVDPSLLFAPCSSYIKYEPLGVALIMGSWNFPYFVTIKPLIMAIAAGNCAIVKPSELGPNSAAAMQALIEKYLDKRCVRVI